MSVEFAKMRKQNLKGVVIASPGGIHGGGGMGTVTRSIATWIKKEHPNIPVSVIDPRGDHGAQGSIVKLPIAICKLVTMRIVYGHNVLHLQVSERLSFVRKSVLLFFARCMWMKVVLHHHGAELIPFYQTTSGRMRRLVKWTISAAGHNIVLGERWRKFLIEEINVDNGHISILPNAVPDIGDENNLNCPEPWHYIVIANLSDRKGIRELLEAVVLLKNERLPIRLTLAGGGEVKRFTALAQELGIGEKCHFTGWLSPAETLMLLKSGASMILPSHNEGFPMSLLEAMSAGMPIITTPVGSIPEHLSNNVHCLYVAPGNVEQIKDAMVQMATDSKLRERLLLNARRLYEERFSFDTYMHRMFALYENLHS